MLSSTLYDLKDYLKNKNQWDPRLDPIIFSQSTYAYTFSHDLKYLSAHLNQEIWKEALEVMLRYPEQAVNLGRAYVKLHESGLIDLHAVRTRLQAMPRMAITYSRHIIREIDKFKNTGLSSCLDIFKLHVHDATFLLGINHLYKTQLLDKANFNLLVKHFPHADQLGQALAKLIKNQIYTAETRRVLISCPAYAKKLADAMCYLSKEKLLNSSTQDLILDDPHHAILIAAGYVKNKKIHIQIAKSDIPNATTDYMMTISKLSDPQVYEDQIVQKIGEMLIKKGCKLPNSTFIDAVLAQRIGCYFINRLNGKSDQLNPGEVRLLCHLIMLERTKQRETLPRLNWIQPDRLYAIVEKSNDTIYKFYTKEYFENLLKPVVDNPNPLIKYRDSFSLIATALELSDLPDEHLSPGQLTKFVNEIVGIMEAEHVKKSAPTFSTYVDLDLYENAHSKIPEKQRKILHNPFHQVTQKNLHLMLLLANKMEDDYFRNPSAKNKCLRAIGQALLLKNQNPHLLFKQKKDHEAIIDEKSLESAPTSSHPSIVPV